MGDAQVEPRRAWRSRAANLALLLAGTLAALLLLEGALRLFDPLQQRLRGAFPRVWIDNAGLDGHSTFGHALLLDQRLLRLAPQVLLFLIGANDVGRDDLNAYDLAAERGTTRPVPLLTRAARHSLVVATALNVWRSERARRRGLGHAALDLARVPRVAFKEAPLRRTLARHERAFLPAYRERVRALIERCRGHGVLPVLITQPALFGPAVDDVTGLDLGAIAVDATDWGAEAACRLHAAPSARTLIFLHPSADLKEVARCVTCSPPWRSSAWRRPQPPTTCRR
jgi:hypothetical protein